MPTLLSLLIPDFTKLVTDHLYDIISAVVGFLLALFVSDPIKRWWRGRGKVAEARNAMYQDLAEIYTETQIFTEGVNKAATDKDTNPDVLIGMMEAFYERIKSHNYDQDLKTLRSRRTSIAAEVRGFENVLGLIDLPSSRAPTLEKAKAVIEFTEKFERAIASEQFDRERLSAAITNVRKQEALRNLKLFGAALGQLAETFKEVGQRTAQYDKILDAKLEETKKSMQELLREKPNTASHSQEIEAEIDAGKAGESSKS